VWRPALGVGAGLLFGGAVDFALDATGMDYPKSVRTAAHRFVRNPRSAVTGAVGDFVKSGWNKLTGKAAGGGGAGAGGAPSAPAAAPPAAAAPKTAPAPSKADLEAERRKWEALKDVSGMEEEAKRQLRRLSKAAKAAAAAPPAPAPAPRKKAAKAAKTHSPKTALEAEIAKWRALENVSGMEDQAKANIRRLRKQLRGIK